MRPDFIRVGLRRAVLAIGLCCAGLLLSCGGGDLLSVIPGVGTGGTGSVAGTVTGLGSVIVDGQSYDDSQATLERQPDLQQSESLDSSDLQVGQYVYLTLDASGQPTRVQLASQLVGSVTEVTPAAARLRVAGQTVWVNSDASQGPVTVFSGYASLAEIALAQPVQVYGVLQTDPQDATREQIRASRIERLTDSSQLPARITGTLRGNASAGWQLGGVPLDLRQSRRLPDGVVLQAGLVVTAVGAWQPELGHSSQSWAPDAVRVLGSATTAAADTLRLSGSVQLDSSAGVLTLQGVRVDVSAAALGAVLATLKDGDYITVSGPIDAARGQLVASAIESGPAGGRVLELRGSVTSWVDASSFMVRGVPVDASAALWSGASPTGIVNGDYLEVSGPLLGNVLRASQVRRQAQPPDKAVLDLSGLVQSVEPSGNRFDLLTQDGRNLTVQVAPGAALPSVGQTVRVEGRWQGGNLQANRISARAPIDRNLTELDGVIDAVGDGQFRLNGHLIAVDPAQWAALQLVGGEQVEVLVSLVDGRFMLVDLKPRSANR